MRTEDTAGGIGAKKNGIDAPGEDANNIKVREYINSAVYVETIYEMAPCKQNGAVYMNIPAGGDQPKMVKVKRCVCFTNPKECPCHPRTLTDFDDQIPSPIEIKPKFTSSTTALLTKTTERANSFDSDSGITVKATNSTQDDLRLSIASLTTMSTIRIIDEQTKEENFRNWCARKDQERKLQEQKALLLNEMKRKQREQQLEIERENFLRWLAGKKKDEEIKKREEEEKILVEERRKQEERDKRMRENDLNFQLWLKRKEEKLLEKKLKDQMSLIKKEDEKQKRLGYSSKAYEIWLKQSKTKQKPVPLNRGLESLKSSVSVTYINPQPWVPNIDMTQKPTSQ
ncbi:PREDICTED: stress response protein NST1-like [Nicrophorus vespilloides]|uniref:Stress response protein NST1-like n=1 Tax=Nicrophorus vespilloides TaxID=110193 RepID=A0ABM1M639_NICVS|nr:PREDICTED: stress response protein NST1-like [Nicrophorus vespilloides]